MKDNKIINVAIGFVTGRLLFQNVLKTYINNWLEHGLITNKNVRIHILVSYDLRYKNTNMYIPVKLNHLFRSKLNHFVL